MTLDELKNLLNLLRAEQGAAQECQRALDEVVKRLVLWVREGVRVRAAQVLRPENEQEIDDVCAECVKKILERGFQDLFRIDRNPDSYLHRIGKHFAIDYRIRAPRPAPMDLSNVEESLVPSTDQMTFADALVHAEVLRLAKTDDAAAMYLLQLRGASQRAIARDAGMTDGQRKRLNEQIREAQQGVAERHKS